MQLAGSKRRKKSGGGTGKTVNFPAAQPQTGRSDISVLVIALVLTCIGITMVFSASGPLSYEKLEDSTYFLRKEIIWTAISLVFMLLATNFDYRYLKKLATPILIFCILLMIAVLIPGVGLKVKGARRWINLGFIVIHVGEFAKLGLIIFFAAMLSEFKERIGDIKYFAASLIPLGVFGLLIMLQPDFGMTMLIGTITCAMILVAGGNPAFLIGLVGAFMPAAWIIVMHEPYRKDRILGFLNPEADPQGIGFHSIQSMIAIVSGGVFGQGLGQSGQKRFFLPEAQTDFIFSVYVEEFGIAGSLFLIALFVFLAYRGFLIAMECSDRFGFLLAFGITFMITFQAFINMGVAVGLLPVTGLTLPFVSFGGSSLLSMYIGIGILLSISMRNHAQQRKKRSPDNPGVWGNGGTRLPRGGGGTGNQKPVPGN